MAARKGIAALYQNPPGTNEDVLEPREEPEGPVVNVDEDDDDEDDEGEPAAAKSSRKQKKHNRYQEQIDAREQAEREKEELRLQLVRAEARATALQTQVESRGRQDTHPTGGDYDDQIMKVLEEQSNLRTVYDSLSDDDKVSRRNEMQKQMVALDGKIYQLRQKQYGAQPQDPKKLFEQAQMSVFISENMDIFGDARKKALAGSHYQRMCGFEGKAPGVQTMREALDAAREELGGPKLTRGEKARYGGLPVRGAPTNGAAKGPRSVDMRDPRLRAMARTSFPGVEPEEAYKRWAKMVSEQDD